jgi:UDPglucose 6-dehydrogenase
MLVGCIGQGFIGKNYADHFEEMGHTVVRYSVEPEYIVNKERIRECDIVLVAVPTPTTPNGFDDSVLRAVIPLTKDDATVIIKSTIVPGTTEALQAAFPTRFIMHAPEFLREHSAREDVRHPVRNVLGIPADTPVFRERAERAMTLFAHTDYQAIVSAREAELIKYAANCLLYTKTVFVNLLYDLAESEHASWDTIRDALKADPRIGPSHLDPVHKSGPTATTVGRGACGHCFIKDFEALRRMYAALNDPTGLAVLDALVAKNNELLRTSGKDLDLLKGVYGI